MKNKDRIKRLETLVDTLVSMQIEGVEFSSFLGVIRGIFKEDKSLEWEEGNGWVVVPKDLDYVEKGHLVPVDKYTVGRVYKYRGEKGNNPEDYFLCTKEDEDRVNTISWSKDTYSPLNYDHIGITVILEVQAI